MLGGLKKIVLKPDENCMEDAVPISAEKVYLKTKPSCKEERNCANEIVSVTTKKDWHQIEGH
eukprot:CAMPEP_0206372476 /NCGR_PEP_ID=MMETSP0294-20121207/7133_1 /ASSEMBLY_ACC=CAM_ASM_000327 /TAXON_ID=39354 /ORGANISM="Heterosigma akashiwo, Strain CCMP2393" /LENGTH=61 /DNA_ID=CAMNT_0053819865 /DNA_START=260 /DNA_END=445 /DNA_ORIENTATION=+